MGNCSGPNPSLLLDVARNLVRAEARGVSALEGQLDDRLVTVARRLVEMPGKVLTAGAGTSGEIARRMAHLLAVTGTPSVFIHPADALHGGLGAVTPDDVVIAISKGTGESSEINEFVRRARERGAFVVVVTGDGSSEFAKLGSMSVVLRSDDEAEPGGIVAMGSTLVVAAWGDALAVVAMEIRGYAWDDVLFTHPAGAVGRRAPAHAAGGLASDPEPEDG